MAFSHTIGGTTFTQANFEGNAYSDEAIGFPKAMEKMVEHVANAYRGTSTTSNAVGSGSKTWTVTNSNSQIPAFAVGMPVRVARTSAPTTTYMQGEITAFTASTGSTTVNISSSLGSGTHTNWTITIGRHQTTASASPLGIAAGGTGASTHTANNVLVGAGTSAVTSVAPSTSGNMLTSNGTVWASTAPTPEFANWAQSSGHLTPDNATYGIHLGVATATASNLQDDYEEGTFTPTAAGNFSGTVDMAEGHYTKIGNTISFWAHVRFSATSDASSCSIAGLPFTSAAFGQHHHAISQGYTFSDVGPLYPQVSGGSAEVFWYTTGTGSAGIAPSYTEIGTNAAAIRMSVAGTYRT